VATWVSFVGVQGSFVCIEGSLATGFKVSALHIATMDKLSVVGT